ncbi:MAG: YggT family protein [Candidatus Limnocylindria bacterium]
MAVGRDDHHDHAPTERIEHVEHVDRTAPGAVPVTNVSVGPAVAANDPVVAVTRVITLVFTVLEVLLFLRFTLKLLGANIGQPLVAGLYGITEPLVRPFQGIFPEPQVGVVIDIAALIAVLFLFLVAALIVALVRAIAGRPVY